MLSAYRQYACRKHQRDAGRFVQCSPKVPQDHSWSKVVILRFARIAVQALEPGTDNVRSAVPRPSLRCRYKISHAERKRIEKTNYCIAILRLGNLERKDFIQDFNILPRPRHETIGLGTAVLCTYSNLDVFSIQAGNTNFMSMLFPSCETTTPPPQMFLPCQACRFLLAKDLSGCE